MSKKTDTVTRHLVLTGAQLNDSSEAKISDYIQSYNAKLDGFQRFSKDCAQMVGGVVVAETTDGNYAIVANYRRGR
jgi:hypothetical protein